MLGPDGAIRVDRIRGPAYRASGRSGRCNRVNSARRDHEGVCFSAALFGEAPRSPDHGDVPAAVFSQPPVGTVGLTEAAASQRYGEIDVYRTTFRTLKHTLTHSHERTLMKLDRRSRERSRGRAPHGRARCRGDRPGLRGRHQGGGPEGRFRRDAGNPSDGGRRIRHAADAGRRLKGIASASNLSDQRLFGEPAPPPCRPRSRAARTSLGLIATLVLAALLRACRRWQRAGQRAAARGARGGVGLRPLPRDGQGRPHPRGRQGERRRSPGALALHPGRAHQARQPLPALPGQEHLAPVRLLRRRRRHRLRRGRHRHRLPRAAAPGVRRSASPPTPPKDSRTTSSSGGAGCTTWRCRRRRAAGGAQLRARRRRLPQDADPALLRDRPDTNEDERPATATSTSSSTSAVAHALPGPGRRPRLGASGCAASPTGSTTAGGGTSRWRVPTRRRSSRLLFEDAEEARLGSLAAGVRWDTRDSQLNPYRGLAIGGAIDARARPDRRRRGRDLFGLRGSDLRAGRCSTTAATRTRSTRRPTRWPSLRGAARRATCPSSPSDARRGRDPARLHRRPLARPRGLDSAPSTASGCCPGASRSGASGSSGSVPRSSTNRRIGRTAGPLPRERDPELRRRAAGHLERAALFRADFGFSQDGVNFSAGFGLSF